MSGDLWLRARKAWSQVTVGDLIVKDGNGDEPPRLWEVLSLEEGVSGAYFATVRQVGRTNTHESPVNTLKEVDVLDWVAPAERDALELIGGQLGTRVITE